MDFKSDPIAADILRTFGFVVMRQFFDGDLLAAEIDRVMRDGFASQRVTDYGGINFQYVPMTAQLERLGVYDLAARQEAFTRSRKRSAVDL